MKEISLQWSTCFLGGSGAAEKRHNLQDFASGTVDYRWVGNHSDSLVGQSYCRVPLILLKSLLCESKRTQEITICCTVLCLTTSTSKTNVLLLVVKFKASVHVL